MEDINELKKLMFLEVMGFDNLIEKSNQSKVMINYNEYDLKFLELEEDYKDDKEFFYVILECHRELTNLYNSKIYKYIDEFRNEKYINSSIDYIILNTSQEELFMQLEDFANKHGFPQSLKNDFFENIKYLAERLDKRFCFDDIALINLIEASCGKNIVTEEGFGSNHMGKIVSYSNGYYSFRDSSNKEVYTINGKPINNPNNPVDKLEDEILLKSFPLGNKTNNFSRNTAMKKVMQTLFENFNLCIETYNSVYKSGDNIILNTAKLTNGSSFDFECIINEKNIPHLLGILPARSLSSDAINYLNLISNKQPYELNTNSKAYHVLMVIYLNQNKIIESGGLYSGSDGKLYEILNWEKVILKTTSFMRCDFFKTCFCLAKLSRDKYLNDSRDRGGYVGIASTEYQKGLHTARSARSVLNDLLNTRRQRKDFIFRGFHLQNNGLYVPNSIMTGKAETVHVGQRNELLLSLQRYRHLFEQEWVASSEKEQVNFSSEQNSFEPHPDDDLFASIVEEIENEKFIKKFSPEEIAQLGLDMSRDLGIAPQLSEDALAVIQDINNYDDQIITNEELQNLGKSNGRKI